jgi:hypothetical protein
MTPENRIGQVATPISGNAEEDVGGFLTVFSVQTANSLEDTQISGTDKGIIVEALTDIMHWAPELVEIIETIDAKTTREKAFHSLWRLLDATRDIASLAYVNDGSDNHFKRNRAKANGYKTGEKATAKAQVWRDPALKLAKKIRLQNPKAGQGPIADKIIETIQSAPGKDTIIKQIRAWESGGALPLSTRRNKLA